MVGRVSVCPRRQPCSGRASWSPTNARGLRRRPCRARLQNRRDSDCTPLGVSSIVAACWEQALEEDGKMSETVYLSSSCAQFSKKIPRIVENNRWRSLFMAQGKLREAFHSTAFPEAHKPWRSPLCAASAPLLQHPYVNALDSTKSQEASEQLKSQDKNP